MMSDRETRVRRVRVHPEALQWAIDRSSDPERLRAQFPSLPAWLSGQKQPTMRQLEAFARATSTPFGFLLLDRPPDEDLPDALASMPPDAASSRPSASLLSVMQTMQTRQAWMRDTCIALGLPPLSFVGAASIQSDPVHVASHMQQTLNLDSGWAQSLPDWTHARRRLIDAADAAGVVVAVDAMADHAAHRPRDPAAVRGFALVDSYAPFVLLNAADDASVQIVALVQGLAHLWVGTSAAFDLNHLRPAPDATETVCFRIATAFLLPASDVRNAWSDACRFDDPVGRLARMFKVHEPFVAQRCVDLQLLDPQDGLVMRPSASPGARRRSRSLRGVIDRLGRRFASMIVEAACAGDVLYHEAYALTGLAGTDFDRLVLALMRANPRTRRGAAPRRR